MKVFSKKKYDEWLKARGMKGYPWAEECDGKEVIKDSDGVELVLADNGHRYTLNDAWCIEVPDKKPKVTMEQFIKDKIAVRTGTGEKQKRFLKLCEAQGLRWASGENATDYMPEYRGGDGCIAFNFSDDNALAYCYSTFYKKNGWTVVDFDTFDFADIEGATQVVPKDYDILISCHDGKTTTATLIVDGAAVKTARADCHPADKFKLKTGAEHVLERLFAKKPKKTKA